MTSIGATRKERRNLVYNKVAKHQPITCKSISFLVKDSIPVERVERDKIVSNILYKLKQEGKLDNELIPDKTHNNKRWIISKKDEG